MSHFIHMKYQFQNLLFLKSALKNLNIKFNDKFNEEFSTETLVIPQSNGSNIEFVFDGQEYELVCDLSFWKLPYDFMTKLKQQYAIETVLDKSREVGFHVVSTKNQTESARIMLERWGIETSWAYKYNYKFTLF